MCSNPQISRHAPRRLAAILSAVLVVLAGCSSKSADDDSASRDPVRADDDDDDDGDNDDQEDRLDGSGSGKTDSGSRLNAAKDGGQTMLDASLDSTKGDAAATRADAAGNGTKEAGPKTPVQVGDYNKAGPYGPVKQLLNQGTGLVSGGSAALIPLGNENDPSGFTLYFPEGGMPDETFPILTFGNGTVCSPTFYDEFIGHVVSYGFIVIAPNTSNTGTGVEMLQGVDWVIEQNQKSGSPIFGKANVEKIGAFGHSQGGAGTCRAGADPRIDAIATLSGTSEVDKIQGPAFFVLSGGEAGSAPDERIETTLSQAMHPSMFGVTVSGNHDEYTDKADEGITAAIGLTSDDGLQSRAAVTAWFDWQLKDMAEVGQLFLQDPCAFCNPENLQRLDLKGF